jgi:hypothetical protein
VNLNDLRYLFLRAGAKSLYSKVLAANDNSKNQIYFSCAVEALNVFPSQEIKAENSKRCGPTFKARLNFGWLSEDGTVSPAPHAQLILYSQYPEVRFSGFLRGCANAPSHLMADRDRAKNFTDSMREALVDRVLFLGVTEDRKVVGYVASGTSEVAADYKVHSFMPAMVVFSEIPLPYSSSDEERRLALLSELRRIHRLGWIKSKQLDSKGILKPCRAPQCGGFTLEAELGIPKNSIGEPDFLGWEVKQLSVKNFSNAGGAITLMTPEPNGGFYSRGGVEAFIRKYGYPDKNGVPDRMNFGGVHRVGRSQPSTGLTMQLQGYDIENKRIVDAGGSIDLVDGNGDLAASWAFQGLFEHWSRKHTRAVYIPGGFKRPAQSGVVR